jgi:hypothetical protein
MDNDHYATILISRFQVLAFVKDGLGKLYLDGFVIKAISNMTSKVISFLGISVIRMSFCS